MVLFGVNFNAYYFLLLRQIKKTLAIEEIRVYFGMLLAAFAVITINIVSMYDSVSHAIRDAAFQVASMTTSTGFSTTNYDNWPYLSKTIILLLMTIGACSGSTGGGTKVSRFVIMFKALGRELHQYAHPKSVKKLRIDGGSLDGNIIRSTAMYFVAFFLVFVASLLIVSYEGYDYLTNFSAVLATINNIGPGMNLAGPTESFSFFSPLSKIVFVFDMLAGRLELFPILMLFNYKVWKKH
jgi:trk system potassium uptake protein TrkH